jgi:hypothetical protein
MILLVVIVVIVVVSRHYVPVTFSGVVIIYNVEVVVAHST